MQVCFLPLSALFTFGLLASSATFVQQSYEQVLAEDLIGAQDHPLTGRYEGSTLLLQGIAEFDELVLPAGKAEGVGGNGRHTQTAKAEGKVTRTVYVVPPGRSSLEVLRNHQNHLIEQGFSTEFECSGEDGCGESFKRLKYYWEDKSTHVSSGAGSTTRARYVSAVFDGGRDIRYALMRKGATLVGLFVARSEGGTFGDISKSLTNYVISLIEVVEPKPMQQQILTVKSEAIASGLQVEGSIALYGLLFDTDKAELKPESEPQLEEMVRYLQSNDVKIYVVGHTDSQGSLDHNLDLSERRAKAVAAALTARGIAASRIIARGVGPLAPAAPNTDEAGRSKNRRVELVLQ